MATEDKNNNKIPPSIKKEITDATPSKDAIVASIQKETASVEVAALNELRVMLFRGCLGIQVAVCVCAVFSLFAIVYAGAANASLRELTRHIDTLIAQGKLHERTVAPVADSKAAAAISTRILSRLGPRTLFMLGTNEVMHSGDLLKSEHDEYELAMQADGNLVLYRGRIHDHEHAVWASDTAAHTAITKANLPFVFSFVYGGRQVEIRDRHGKAMWHWDVFFDDAQKKSTGAAGKPAPIPPRMVLKICQGQLTVLAVETNSEGSSDRVACPSSQV